jgi:DNA-binding NarL/FixJ family response regulator
MTTLRAAAPTTLRAAAPTTLRAAAPTTLRVVVADDHPVMRDGLVRSLEAFGLEVLESAGDGRAAVAAVERRRPDVVLLDLAMPGMDGLQATEVIRARHPSVRVVVLTFDADEQLHDRVRRAGASQVLTKDTSAEDIVAAIRGDGGPARPGPGDRRLGLAAELSLTSRELEVLGLVAAGASTSEIASKLYISAKTVKNHLASIYQKLDVADRTQAVLRALRLGLVSLG